MEHQGLFKIGDGSNQHGSFSSDAVQQSSSSNTIQFAVSQQGISAPSLFGTPKYETSPTPRLFSSTTTTMPVMHGSPIRGKEKKSTFRKKSFGSLSPSVESPFQRESFERPIINYEAGPFQPSDSDIVNEDNIQSSFSPKKPLERKRPLKRESTGTFAGIFQRAVADANKGAPSVAESSGNTESNPPDAKKVMIRAFGAPFRRTSSSSVSVVEKAKADASVALRCTNIPEKFNNKKILRNHFSRFGTVVYVRSLPSKSAATIKYLNSADAKRAKQDPRAKNLHNHEIKIFSGNLLKKTQPTDRMEDEHQRRETSDGPMPSRNPVKRPSMQSPEQLRGAPRKVQAAITAKPPSVCKKRQIFAKTDSDKLALLEKIDTILRSRTVKESDLSKAIVAKGTCPDMCPEKERYFRLYRNLLSNYELDSDKKFDHTIVVKEYSRSSADQEEALPHELRPSPVLRIAMDYLLTHVMNSIDRERIADWFDFLWNRTRAIRKEISIQQLKDLTAVQVAEECARFHICCGHELCEEDSRSFDMKINNENLEKAMKTVLDLYNDMRRDRSGVVNEPEFSAYHILLNINKTADVLRELQTMSVDVRMSRDVQLAVAAFSAAHNNNYARFFSVVRHASYLQAAIMHRYFNQMRRQAVLTMARAYSTSKGTASLPLKDLVRLLHFNDDEDATAFCFNHMITVNGDMIELNRSETYEASGTVEVNRSVEISSKMAGRNLGQIIARHHIPSEELHQPTSSFDADGRYIGPYLDLLMDGPKVETNQAMPSTSALPEPSSNRAIADVPEKIAVPNMVVKVTALTLFREVIDEMVLGLSREVVLATVQVTATKKLCDEILEEFVVNGARNISAAALAEEKLEMERELKRKQQAAEQAAFRAKQMQLEKERKEKELRLKKEKEESVARSCISIADEILLEQVSDLAAEETRSHVSHVIGENVTKTDLNTLLHEIVADVMKQETRRKHEELRKEVLRKRAVLNFIRWRRSLRNLRKRRHNCEMFPSGPYLRDVHQQVVDLLPPDVQVRSRDRRGSFPLDRKENCWLSMEPVSRTLDLHDNLKIKVSKLADEQVKKWSAARSDPLPLPKIFFESYVRRRLLATQSDESSYDPGSLGEHFWKLGLLCQSAASSSFVRWLRRKFGCEDCQSSFETKSFSLLRAEEPTISLFTCCKTFERSVQSDTFGMSALIAVIDHSHDIHSAKAKLFSVLESKPPRPALPLLITSTGSELRYLAEGLELDVLLQRGLISSHHILSLNNATDFVRNSAQLETGLKWLASQCPDPPSLACASIRDVFEEQVSRNYVTPLCRHRALREKLGLPALEPQTVIDLYNEIVSTTRSVLSADNLRSVSWPAPEFAENDNASLPPPDWNSESQFAEIARIASCLLLADFDAVDIYADFSSLRRLVLQYCHKVSPYNQALSTAVDAVLRPFENWEHEHMALAEQLPWQLIIDTVASSLFGDVLYQSSNGDLRVAYDPSLMQKTVHLPQHFGAAFAEVEFDSIAHEEEKRDCSADLSETFHSRSEGATANLTRILLNSTKVAMDTSWFDEDETSEAISEAVQLRSEIKTERKESEMFEKRLRDLLEGDATSFDAGDLSIIFADA